MALALDSGLRFRRSVGRCAANPGLRLFPKQAGRNQEPPG